MKDMKYLYGASVQGIQDFIFKTNKLKEIVGASELVEQICTELFFEKFKLKKEDNNNLLLAAAGNIKYIFENEEDCKNCVLDFPKIVLEFAPGIQISQAVVKFENDDLSNAVDCLEKKLKIQRNKVSQPHEIGFIALERSRRTGGVGYEYEDNEVWDEATLKKNNYNNLSLFNKMSGLNTNYKNIALEIKDITKSGKNSWIAVIHADGNGLGQIIQEKGEELNKGNKFHKFSLAIENATKTAVQEAFKETIGGIENYKNGKFPIRPIVIGGDDLTVIIRADLALKFTEVFLISFEKHSESEFKKLELSGYEKGLTACAGIAFVKESYPLHYALHLAESLCKDAKKKVKSSEIENNDIPKSSLAFYKVQDSFVENLEELKSRTLKAGGINFYKGPYLLEELNIFNDKLDKIKQEADSNEKSKAVGKLRQIVSMSYIDSKVSIFMLERMKKINKDFFKNLNLEEELEGFNKPENTSQLLDLITIHSFNYGNKQN